MSTHSVASKDAMVHALPAAEKVNLLAQALLREFLHRRGYKQTLGIFDQECPRTDKTISSRQLMIDMMKLSKIQERSAKRAASTAAATVDGGKRSGRGAPAAAKPATSTFMELLCGYRVRKQQLRLHQSKDAAVVTGSDGGGASDSSDDERALEVAAAEHQRTLQESCNNEHQQHNAQKALLFSELEKLREREQKLMKKNKKLSSGKKVAGNKKGPTKDGGSKKKKNKDAADSTSAGAAEDADDYSPQRSRGRHGVTPSTSVDALDAAIGRMSSLPLSSSVHGGGGAAVGRNWMPGTGGGGGRAQMLGNIAEIGLNGGSGAMASLGAGMDRPPSFVAGQGMHLMGGGDRSAVPTKEWEAPTRKHSAGSIGGDEDDDDVPSPYRSIGQTPYDHGATRPGILRSSNHNGSMMQQHVAHGNTTPPHMIQHQFQTSSSSSTDQRRQSFDRTPSFGSMDGNSKSPPSTSHSPRGGSPTLNSSGTGIGFHNVQSGGASGGGPGGAGGGATSHRTSRRVTIIVDP
jgi:hypothetical protein